MFINLDATQGEWFEFFSSTVNPDTGIIEYGKPVKGARAEIRSITPFYEELMAAKKPSIERVINSKTHKMDRIEFYPAQTVEEIKAERGDAWDYAIVNFEGFKDKAAQKVLECTRENKIAMMKNPVFDRFVARCLQILGESGVQEKETKAKNSLKS